MKSKGPGTIGEEDNLLRDQFVDGLKDATLHREFRMKLLLEEGLNFAAVKREAILRAELVVGHKAKNCKQGDGENNNAGEGTSGDSNPAEGTAEMPGQGVGKAGNMAEDLEAEGENSNDSEPHRMQEDREVVCEATRIAGAEAGEPASKKISATVGDGEQAELGAQVRTAVHSGGCRAVVANTPNTAIHFGGSQRAPRSTSKL
ncbi:UNVERIFIED_CONTAM: hypothetical protein FKN15_058894 [Acipenser sinensis]